MFFVKWPVSIDKAFRADYLTETKEAIQTSPMVSDDGLDYMVGTDKATQTQLDNLKALHTKISDTKNVEPVGWTPKIRLDPISI